MHKILLIDDDLEISDMLSSYLLSNNFEVDKANTGALALDNLAQQTYDAVILDIMLPDISGYDLLKKITQIYSTPVIIHSARHDSIEKILGLELGADDYIPKPSPAREITAHLRAVLRRTKKIASPQQAEKSVNKYYFKELVVDISQHICTWNNQLIDLTYTEFNFLKLLVINSEKILNKQYLSETALGRPLESYDRSVDVHISNIRQKLYTISGGELTIETTRRVGYKLK